MDSAQRLEGDSDVGQAGVGVSSKRTRQIQATTRTTIPMVSSADVYGKMACMALGRSSNDQRYQYCEEEQMGGGGVRHE
jgi:hypothetical protein